MQHNVPEITVVIPCYNGGAHIATAIQSVINQTYEHWQLIVVDDGSTDNTAEVVHKFKDSRINLIQQKNKGVSAARNHGISAAETEWIAFLDADDEWKTTFLQEIIRSANNFPIAVAIFTDYMVSPPGIIGLEHLPKTPILIDDYFDFFLTHRRGMWTSCTAVKKDALKQIGDFPVGVTHGEDIDTWARLSWIGSFVCFPKALAVYNVDNPYSATKIPLKKKIRIPQVWISYCEWLENSRIPQKKLRSTERYIAYLMFWYIINLIDVGRKQEARKMAGKIYTMNMTSQRKKILKAMIFAPGRSGVKIWRVINALRKGLRDRFGIKLKMKA